MRDLSLHLLDIMQNSIAAKAGEIKLVLRVMTDTGMMETSVEDNGCGMDKELLRNAANPFVTTRTTRKIGLGIPLLKSSAEQSGGNFGMVSEKCKGTTVKAGFAINHVDRPPLGDLAGVITDMVTAFPDVNIELLTECGDKKFLFSSRDIAKVLGEVPLTEYMVTKWIKEFIREGIEDVFGGVLNEINS